MLDVVTPELQDLFNAIAYWRRLVLIPLETDELLRKGTTRPNRRRQNLLLEKVRAEISELMRARKRRPFRGDVAVSISLDAVGHGSVPSAWASVKRYLDALEGLVYHDDKQVAHLMVSRFADDWPGRAQAREELGLGIERPKRQPTAVILVSPIRVFAHDWERVFRLGSEPEPFPPSRRTSFYRDWSKLTADNWTWEDDARLDELLDERRADREGRHWHTQLPGDIASVNPAWRDEEISELLRRRILDETPNAQDHPRGQDHVFDKQLLRQLGLPTPGPRPRWTLPGHFWLPLSGGDANWIELVRETMGAHRASWPVLPAAFSQPLALDIAAYGATDAAKDVDNLARVVVAEFESIYCARKSGTVVSYRVYRRPSNKPGIRVLVMDQARLAGLFNAIEDARSLVIRRGFPRHRDHDW